MNNREWLYSLDVADLADWFDAEHVEHQERALDGDTEPENADSRELILTDLEKKTREWHDYDGNYMRIYSDVAYAQMKELLDRQEAITERETTKRHELFCETCEAESDKQIAELTAERDELQRHCENQRRELAMFNNLVNTHGLAITDDCWDYRSVRELCDENDELQTRLLRVEADCERYRSKFGKCLDYADAIHALMDDEGVA